MSILSNMTGVHISGKGVHIEPKKALLTGLALGIPALGMAGKLGGLVGKGGPGLGALGKFGGFLKGNARTIADYGTLGEGVYDRVQQNHAVDDANQRYRSLQPFRDQSLKELQAPPPDLSSVFADPTNPQGRYRRVAIGSR